MRTKRWAAAFSTIIILIGFGLLKGLSRFRDYKRADSAFNHWIIGQRLSKAGQLAAAVAECQVALELDPSLSGSRYTLAGIYSKQGKIALAEREYQSIIVQESRTQDKTGAAWAHYELGELFKAQGRTN